MLDKCSSGVNKSFMESKRMKWIPTIDPSACNGCQACVFACGPRSLKMIDEIAVLTNPDICGSEEHCIAPCPIDAIHMQWVECDGNINRGRWAENDKKGKLYEITVYHPAH